MEYDYEFSLISDKLKEYDAYCGRAMVSVVLFSDGSGHLEYRDTPKNYVFYSFYKLKTFLESDTPTVLFDGGFIKVIKK